MSGPVARNQGRPVRPQRDRSGAPTSWLVGLALVFVLVTIGTPLLGLRAFSAADLMSSFAPWHSDVATGAAVSQACVGDTVDSVLPTRTEAARRFRAGDYPLWNPWLSGGTTLDATPDPGSFSPVALPYLVLPAWLAPGYVKLLEMAVSIGFGFLFLRRLGLSRAAGVLGGLIYTSSGFMVVWTNWPQTNVAAFLPALFWALERLVQLRTVRSALPIALVVAAMLLGGFPAVTGYALYAGAPYLLLRLLWQERRRMSGVVRPLAGAGGALALGVALPAVQLLPFLHRLGELGLDYRKNTSAAHLPIRTLVTAAVPNAFGGCPAGNYFGPLNQIEVSAYVGSAALVLVVVALLTRLPAGLPAGVRGFMLGGTVVTVVLGWVGGPALALAQRLPVFSNNYVGRIRVLLGFFLAVLAAIGYEALVRRVRPTRPRLYLAAAGWVLIAGVAAYAIVSVHADARGAGQSAYVDPQLLWAVLGGLIAVVAAAAAIFRPRLRRIALLILAATVTVQGAAFAKEFWPEISPSQFYPVTATHRFLAQNLGGDRFAADGQTMLPGTNTYYRLRSVGGHAFTEPQWKDLLNTVDPKAFLTPTYSTLHATPQIVDSPLLDILSVRYFLTAPETMPLGQLATTGVATGSVPVRSGTPLMVPLPAVPADRLRGVGVDLPTAVSVTDRFARVDVEVLGPDGSVLTRGSRRIFPSTPPGPFVVAVPQVASAAMASSARVTLHTGSTGARVGIDGAGRPIGTVIQAPDDRLRLVFADGTTIYRRIGSLPRVRWASSTVVIGDVKARLAALANGQIRPDAVVLNTPGPAASGRPASVHVQTDSDDGLTVRVQAAGAGYLVVADALLDGWEATVDGRRVQARPVDHALLGVPVPEGSHEVALRYSPPGLAKGTALSAVAVLVLAALWFVPLFRRGGRGSRPGDPRTSRAVGRRTGAPLRRRVRVRPEGGSDPEPLPVERLPRSTGSLHG